MANKIEIEGLDELRAAFNGLPKELEASVIRNIARKPASKVVSRARELADYLTPVRGAKRSITILPVKNLKQTFVEIGIKGKSWLYVFLFSRGRERHKDSGASTGTIKPVGNIFEKAADQVQKEVIREISVDITKTIAKGLRRYGVK